MPVHTTEESNKIGVYEAIAYCLGDIVGSGIFVSPTAILRHSGSVGLSLCIWIGGALIAVIGALVYVELGTCIRKSGCDFAYLTHAKWHPLAVAFLWVSVSLTYPTILAIQTLTFGKDYWLDTLKRLIGFMALGLLVFINMFSLSKFAGRFQVVVTISKLCVISIIICTGIYYILFKGRTEVFENSFKNSSTDAGNIALALYASLFAYNGWDILNFGTEEIENPRRTLPVAALCGIGIAAVVYVAMNVAYFSVMTVDEFVASDAVAVSILWANLAIRYLFAGAKKNVVPSMVKCVHEESMSPRAAIIVELFAAVSISFMGDLDHLIGYMSFAMWMQRACSQCALLYMRFMDWPFPKDAFRTPIFLPIIFLIICVCLLVVPARNDPHIAIYGGSAVGAGLLIYFIFVYPNCKPSIFHQINESSVIATQLALNVVPTTDSDEEA
uniref:Amino acid transporter n=1 Tax=Ditylenchus dipsaci TaxID=166011 RepID=A0A915ELA2_9BILA